VRVLVVDDSAEQRMLFVSLMRSTGHEAVEVTSGEAAVSLARSGVDFDLVLMDNRMPGGIDGLEATRQLRQLGGKWASIPIIAMSLTEGAVPWRVAGADDFFDKTGGPESLLRMIEAIIPRQAPAVVAPPSPAPSADGVIFVPRSIIFAAALAVPALVASASWYMSTQSSQAVQLAAAVSTAREELQKQAAVQSAEIRAIEDAFAKMRAEHSDSGNALDQRVTRIEAQLLFLVSEEKERRDVIEEKLKFIADNIRQQRK
jgi:CheY-like chemotaxis protein